MTISASHSRGIALSFKPPASDTTASSIRSERYFNTRPIRILALACSLSISLPECPPSKPVTVSPAPYPCCFCHVTGIIVSTVIPPAQLVRKCPSTSESIFNILWPFNMERSMTSAPSMPISSSTVITASSLGCAISGESIIARI